MKFEAVKSEKIKKAFDLALFAVKEQVMTDCNFYVRVDQGVLRDSIQSTIKNDVLSVSWNTPYAKKVYYTGKPSHDVNKYASLQWAEKASRFHYQDWEFILRKGMAENL